MSITKRILFDRDTTFDGARARMRTDFETLQAEFPFRIAGKRKARAGTSRYWDAWWPASLTRSAEALGIETLHINGGVFVRTEDERNTLQAAAERMWMERRPR